MGQRMRFAVDTGGTFTDLVVENDDGEIRLYKAETTPGDAVAGVLAAFDLAAADLGVDRAALLGQGNILIHGTTHAINAIITGQTARTAFFTTKGHPDILVIREGSRTDFFNFRPYPDPYIPRSLTYEVPERIDDRGGVHEALDGVVAAEQQANDCKVVVCSNGEEVEQLAHITHS